VFFKTYFDTETHSDNIPTSNPNTNSIVIIIDLKSQTINF